MIILSFRKWLQIYSEKTDQFVTAFICRNDDDSNIILHIFECEFFKVRWRFPTCTQGIDMVGIWWNLVVSPSFIYYPNLSVSIVQNIEKMKKISTIPSFISASLISLALFSKYLKWEDPTLGIIGCISSIVGALICAFATASSIFVLGNFFLFLKIYKFSKLSSFQYKLFE